MQRADLADAMGGGSRVSDFFKGKRELSKNQARALHDTRFTTWYGFRWSCCSLDVQSVGCGNGTTKTPLGLNRGGAFTLPYGPGRS